MSLIRKHGAVLQAWACLDLVFGNNWVSQSVNQSINQNTLFCIAPYDVNESDARQFKERRKWLYMIWCDIINAVAKVSTATSSACVGPAGLSLFFYVFT